MSATPSQGVKWHHSEIAKINAHKARKYEGETVFFSVEMSVG